MQPAGGLTRVQRSWFATCEAAVLVSIAARLPRWIRPDHLTGLGVVGAFLSGLGFVASTLSSRWLWLVCLGLIINWFGDSLDGSLARVRNIERPRYGFFVDHASDVVAQAVIFLGLGASPYIHFEAACLLLLSYWIASLFTFIRAAATRVFQISYFGIGPTEIRAGLLGYTLLLISFGSVNVQTKFGALSPLDGIAVAIFVIVFICYVVMALREARYLAALEVSSDGVATGPTREPSFAPLALQDTSIS
jgi:archaetidylinositol phosphate synthase